MAGTIVTIGSFDGAHAGHAALLRCARAAAAAAGPGARVVALAFDPHPASVLRPGSAPPRLSTFAQRREWLLALGADEVRRLEPALQLLALTPGEFIEQLAAEHRPAAVVEGADFRFGRGRAGDVTTLRELGRRFGFAVHIVDPLEVALADQSVVAASSTIARWLVGQGRVGDAALVLGRFHELEGEVVPGDRRGRQLGYPTANLRTECLVPADGIYAGWALAENGLSLPAAVSVGDKPTFAGSERAVEAFLLTQAAGRSPERWGPLPGLPEYGWRMRLQLVAWLRDQARFESVAALVDQIERDCARTAQVIEMTGTRAGRAGAASPRAGALLTMAGAI